MLEHGGVVQVESPGGVGHLVPQLQGELEVALGVGEAVGGLGLQSRLQRRGQRPSRLVGPDPVVGEPGRRGAAGGLTSSGRSASTRAKAACSLDRSPGSSSPYSASWVSVCRSA